VNIFEQYEIFVHVLRTNDEQKCPIKKEYLPKKHINRKIRNTEMQSAKV